MTKQAPRKRIKKQTTINLPVATFKWLKQQAHDDNRSLSTYLERLANAERRRVELKAKRCAA